MEPKADGLMTALKEMTDNTARIHRIRCTFKCPAPVEIAEDYAATQLYQIAQEAVNNAIKHGRPKHVTVSLHGDEGVVTLRVRDDGMGFDPAAGSDGMGLRTMKYRAGMIGAALDISPGHRQGTCVTCTLGRPVAPEPQGRPAAASPPTSSNGATGH